MAVSIYFYGCVMFIQSVKTPNPNAMKFFPGGVVMSEGVRDFLDAESASVAPLAAAVFALDGVEQVFFGSDFISVTKTDEVDWAILKPQVIVAILNNYVEGGSLFGVTESVTSSDDVIDTDYDDPIVAQILDLLAKYVIPRIEADGGYVEFKGYKDGVVFLKLRGACATCPSASMTLQHGIKSLIMAWIPEITEVEAVA